MVTNQEQYQTTQEWLAEFSARLARLVSMADDTPQRASRISGTRGQIATLQRELAMWEAGIREPVPGTPAYARAAEDISERDAALLLKRAEVANIDTQIGILLDRIADWRRHRAWLEREITELEAATPERQPQQSHAG